LNFYLSLSRVTREPRLKNYYDSAESSGGATPQFETNSNGLYDFSKPLVTPETMNNAELGASFNNNNVSASLNFFYMLFNNEIVKNGMVDRFGQPVTGNMDRTIHYGFEAMFNTKIIENVELVLNGSFSKNYIDKGFTYFKKSALITRLDLAGNRISGFPDVMFNAILKINYGGLIAQLSGKFVGDFYTDNYDENLASYRTIYPSITDYTDNKVDAYFTSNFFASYDLELDSYLKNLRLFIQVNNLFDNLYAAYGIGKEFFPAAERNILIGLKAGL
jgi:iron complex outermembrane receptor protein